MSDKIRQLTAPQLAYAIWLSMPNPEPKTKTAWAEQHEVSRDTLWEWEHLDSFVAKLDELERRAEAAWARARANLERIACQTQDNAAAVAAIRELGKLLKKYPNEKLDLTLVDRVAYTHAASLRDLSEALDARPN